MKLFLDSNIWVSALGAKGFCRELTCLVLQRQEQGQTTIYVSDAVHQETRRILRDKFRVPPEALDAAWMVMSRCVMIQPRADWCPPIGFPDPDDVPIIAAALTAGAELFVTGDLALLALGVIEGMPLVDPRTAYLRLG